MRHSLRLLFSLLFLLWSASSFCQGKYPIVWQLDGTSQIGGLKPVVIGEPVLEHSDGFTSLYFNGESDGIIIPLNPVQKLKKFTVEVLFKPAADGTREQRFVHFQDIKGNRGLIEVRLQDEQWWLDTYLHVGKTDEGFTLVNRSQRLPCEQWYWAALVYDGKTMRHYLNADEELSGEIDFGPMESGIISLGVRLNQLFWFKGNISEVRFHSKPLKKHELQRVF